MKISATFRGEEVNIEALKVALKASAARTGTEVPEIRDVVAKIKGVDTRIVTAPIMEKDYKQFQLDYKAAVEAEKSKAVEVQSTQTQSAAHQDDGLTELRRANTADNLVTSISKTAPAPKMRVLEKFEKPMSSAPAFDPKTVTAEYDDNLGQMTVRCKDHNEAQKVYDAMDSLKYDHKSHVITPEGTIIIECSSANANNMRAQIGISKLSAPTPTVDV